ncbi:MAG: c-type cytochrome [Planctomycetaceae bacterium]|nr:c-type cytochrome [Planctomycetaceae bacterium]
MRGTAVLLTALTLILVVFAGSQIPETTKLPAVAAPGEVDAKPTTTSPAAAEATTVAAAAVPADADYSGELPRLKPLAPADALQSFQVRPGFHVELVAAEPLLRDPVALDFDEDGRMYVVEFVEYNQYANPEAKAHGVVTLLEDLDGDGVYETAHPFLDPIEQPVAVACWDGGVFIGATPDLLYCKDTDGDGRADVREVVYTGFGRDHAGEGMLNSFRWGLDNRFHVCTNISGGEVRRADRPDAPTASVRGQGFIFDPRSREFELTSGGGQHGMSFDDWDRTFVCGNSEPTHMVMYDGRYVARNPYLQAPTAAINIAPGGKFTKLFRASQNEPWRVLRTRLRKSGAIPGSDEGGEPSGFFTGATGVTVYRGDAWPAEYRGNVFVGEVSGNLVFRARLEPEGVGFTAPRADDGVEFLASTDNWFRPVQLANSPDGNLYMIDMYRELIEGAAFIAPPILQHLDVSSGQDRGRIYRIVSDSAARRPPPKLSQASTAELVALLEHPNGWHRDTASRLLYQRQDRSAVEPLRKLAAESQSPLGRMHALYALKGLDALDAALVLPALGDASPDAREHALILAEGFADDPSIRKQMAAMVDDPSQRVRYQLAYSIGALSGDAPVDVLLKLAGTDGEDSWMRLAILSSVAECAGPFFAALLADPELRATPHGSELLGTLVDQVGAANKPDVVSAVLRALQQLPESESALLQQSVLRLAKAQPADAPDRLQVGTDGKIGDLLSGLVDQAQEVALNADADPDARAAAVRTLSLAGFDGHRAAFEQLLTSSTPQPVQAAVLQLLAKFDSPEIPGLILAAWPTFSPQIRATATETLFARGAWVRAVLDAVERGELGRSELDPARIALLQQSGDEALRTRAAALFSGTQLSKRQTVVDDYQQALTLSGDVSRGREVFRKTCAVCHKLEDIGESVGADLKAIRDRGVEAVLLNILDPNREVKPQYLNYVLERQDGRIVTGMITTETANSVTLRRADGTSESVLRLDIAELRSTGLSYMPEGLEQQVDKQAMADLLAYLGSIK